MVMIESTKLQNVSLGVHSSDQFSYEGSNYPSRGGLVCMIQDQVAWVGFASRKRSERAREITRGRGKRRRSRVIVRGHCVPLNDQPMLQNLPFMNNAAIWRIWTAVASLLCGR
ncbi:MAG: hypothetical protein ACI8UO_003309 [Verrucomicrobiales bacterium]|jgi:hypothetical protein